MCEAHASEISKLSFCLNHRKLAESEGMCEDCSSSTSQPDYVKLSSKSFGFLPWMKQIGMIQDATDYNNDTETENEKESLILKCSCCGIGLDSRFYPSCFLIKPSFRVLNYSEKQNLITDDRSDRSRSDFAVDHQEDELSTEENKGSHVISDVDENCACSVCDNNNTKEAMDDDDESHKLDLGKEKGEQEAIEEENLKATKDDQVSPQHLEFFILGDGCRLIPIENQNRHNGEEDVILDFDLHADAEAEPLIENWHTEAAFSAHENAEEVSEKEDLEQNYLENSLKFGNVEADMERREETNRDVSLG